MAISLLVVEQRAALQGILGPRDRHAVLPQLPHGGGGELERVQAGARVAFAARGEELDRILLHERPTQLACYRPAQHHRDLLCAEGR